MLGRLVPLWDREKERDKREMGIIYINLWSRHPYSPLKDCENLEEPIRNNYSSTTYGPGRRKGNGV